MRHVPIAELFGAGSVAEVPIIGRWVQPDGREVEVSGRIDRLARIGGGLVLADFKTDRVPPATPADIGGAYVSQLALYAAALGRAMPGNPVEALVVYTRGPLVHRIPPERLATALSALEGG